MKIEVAKSDLEKALKVVNVGSSGTGSDLTTHLLFRSQNDIVEVLAYNGAVGASSPVVCNASIAEDEETPAFTVESRRLNQWLAAASDAAVTLDFKDAVVKATSPMGSVRFRSLDPSGFPFWDKQFSKAKKTMEIGAKRLKAALDHAKSFVAVDTGKPEMAVVEIRNGTLWATDLSGLSTVTLPEFAKSELRLAGKAIPSVSGFLGACGDTKIEVLEHKKSTFFRREDGGVLNVSRPPTPFLELEDIEDIEDLHWWVLDTDEVSRAIQQLTASAAQEDQLINFNLDPSEQEILLSMTGASGSKNTLRLRCPEFGSKEDVELGLPMGGWTVEYPYVTRLLSSYKGGKTVRLGLNPSLVEDDDEEQSGGWTKVVEDRDGDKYVTVLVWMP